MKNKFVISLLIAIMILVAVGPVPAFAGAYETDFRTAITYQNIGSGPTTTLSILFYENPDDTTPIQIARSNLNRFAGTSVAIGTLSLPANFEGTAVMAADQPLAATLVQNPQSTTVRIQPLSNGFSSGTPQSLLGTVVKNTFGAHTRFAVQNAGSAATDVSIQFINTSATVVHTINDTLQAGAGLHVDAGTISQLGSSFNGSVVISTAGGSGSIVSSAMELDYGGGVGAKAFEGVGQGSQTVYMPSAVCQNSGMNSAFAVQNTSMTTSTNVTVTYQPGGQTQTFNNLGPGAKTSFISCSVLPTNYLGAAVITSSATNIIAVGKISGNGAATAFVGFADGGTTFAFPYVRWATQTNYNSGYMPRTNLTIQNTGAGNIPAGGITVTYYDRDGNPVGTHSNTSSIGQYAKFNSNASLAGLTEFGCYNGCTQYGGSAVVTVNGAYEIAPVARNSSRLGSTYPSEDYNGIVMP